MHRHVPCLLDEETASRDSELYQTLEHLKHIDGTFEDAGFEVVKKLIGQDYAPSGHLVKQRSRHRVFTAWRKHKERPTWWFKRFDKYLDIARQRDPGFSLTDDPLVGMYLNRLGLDQRENR